MDAAFACGSQSAHTMPRAWRLPQVETHYISKGWLLPDFYQNWWIGLNKNSSGSWVWTDGLAVGEAARWPSGSRLGAAALDVMCCFLRHACCGLKPHCPTGLVQGRLMAASPTGPPASPTRRNPA
jgi:hypothetical protein